MPRNSSGVYTLPISNPVAPNTLIATSWANPTMSDIATELTNSLDRNGRGGMLAPFKIADGTISLPGLGFTNEPSIGLYRSGSAVASLVNGGTELITLRVDRAVSATLLEHRGMDIFKTTGFKSWQLINAAGLFKLTPSTLVDGEVWDTTKASYWDPDSGAPHFPSQGLLSCDSYYLANFG